MEENQTESQTQPVEEVSQPQSSSNSGVSFPTVGQEKKSGGAKTLLTLGILALVAVLGYLIFRSTSGKAPSVSPTPVETIAPVEEPTSTASPTSVDKSKVKIEVQNGTGITGEAAFLQNELKKLGYTTVSVGNASSQDNTTTTVTFSKTLASSVVDELTKKLKELYKEVDVKTSSSSSIDVLIVTGLRKGSTAKPSASSTPKVTSSAAATSTSSSSPSATPTATSN